MHGQEFTAWILRAKTFVETAKGIGRVRRMFVEIDNKKKKESGQILIVIQMSKLLTTVYTIIINTIITQHHERNIFA